MRLSADDTRNRFAPAAIAVVALVSLIAVPALRAAEAPPAAKQEAESIYKSRCALCHGATGKGDGPAGAALNPKPRDMTDPAWQKSVTDEHIEKIIVGGGPAVGMSPMMAANPDLANKPEVVKALCALVRGLAPK